MTEVIVEYRCVINGKLKDLVFDEPEWYIQTVLNTLKGQGVTEFNIIKNPAQYKLNLD